MEPQPALNLVPTIQQAITNLLTTHEPEFLRFGYGLFLAFATIVLAWQGIRMMFSSDGLGDKMFDFAKVLLFVSFGYGLITFYESPLPGIGVSFSNLITDQAAYFQSVREPHLLDRASADRGCESPFAGSDLLLLDRQCRLRTGGPDLRPVLHRAEARLAVLELAEVVHPVLVHSGNRDRILDDFRAVHVPLCDDVATHDYVG